MITLKTTPIARHFWKIEEASPANNPKDVDTHIRTHIFNPFSDFEQEEMWVLLLNSRLTITHQGMICKGTVDAAQATIRDIFREAIRHNACKLILTHNHPSGTKEPSYEDIQMTKRICNAGELLGITVADHLVIGSQSYTSIREQNHEIFC